VHEEKTIPEVVVPAHPQRDLLIFIPQTDDAAASWLKWFVKYPQLRMVIAMSPRFMHIVKDPHLKAQFQALQKQGRLDIALQIPNAPILPLLMQDPPYGFSDDVIQIIAQSKAGFFKQWSQLPHGIVLPYGADSWELMALLDKLGFTWLVGALEAPGVDGPYQSGSLMVWDATPVVKPVGTRVRVWDERQTKERLIDSWMTDSKVTILPLDTGLVAFPLTSKTVVKSRTWSESDLSPWVGSNSKNSAWNALKKTRQVLEAYKNSGQASVQRLDLAFEEIYSAQSSNYFGSMGNPSLSPALAEERQHEFQATLLSVYRLIGQSPPDDLFQTANSWTATAAKISSTTTHAENFPDGREHVLIEEATGDALVSGGPDLKSLDVMATTSTIRWTVTLASTGPAVIDIYIDLNGQPNAGTPTFLQGRPYATEPADAWEYALSFSGSAATLYRTQGTGTYGLVQTFSQQTQGSQSSVTIPRDFMRGAPKRWGYQVVALTPDSVAPGKTAVISDFLDPLEISQKDLWQDLTSGKRSDIPFIRLRK